MKNWAPACGVLLLALASRALAAPPEIFSALALHPTDPNRIVLAYVWGGQGLLFSNDGGRSFSLRCGAAVSSSFTKSRLPLVLTEDGETLLGTFEGLVRGGVDGCGFADDVDLVGLQIADFAPHPTDPKVTFLATANASDGRRATGLVRRNGDGTFSELGSSSDAGAAENARVSINRLAVGGRAEGGLRFYASAVTADEAGNYRATLRHSDDEGVSWVSFDVAGAEGTRVLLLGVDPTNPDRVAIAIQRDDAKDSLLVSADAGQTFEERLQIFEIGASSVTRDGRLWVGDAGGEAEYSQPGGLYVFDDFRAPARKLATYPVRCLGYRALDGALFGCKRNEFGRIDPANGEFEALTSFAQVGGFVSCAGEELAPVCRPQLCDNWCGVLHYASAPLCDVYDGVNPLCGPAARSYGQVSPATSAAGASNPALPGDAPPTPVAAPGAARPDGACQIGSASADPPLALAAFVAALGLWLRRRHLQPRSSSQPLKWRKS
ncbi:MAG: hypothetical protein ABI895_39795 [Deltaproteobacteria bacterium]